MIRLISFLLLLSSTLCAQGIEFFSGSWEEALARAAAEDKLIFVDAYAEWCGPCKMMSAHVFPQEKVGDYFNANFINVKMDMEKPESEVFRQSHRATAFPTLLYIDARNELVHRVVGARQPDEMLSDARTAISRVESIEELQKDYEADRPGAAFKLVRALIREGESHLKVANDYLRRPGLDFTAPANLRLILISATEADSRLFDLLLQHRAEITALEGSKAFDDQVERAVRNTFDKAVEYRSERLLATAVDKAALLDRDEAKRLESEGEFALALAGNDYKDFVKATKSYLKKGASGDEVRLRKLSATLEKSKFIDYSEVIDLAAEALEGAAEIAEDGWRDYYRLAQFLQRRQRYDGALDAAERSLKTIGEAGRADYRRAIQGLIDQLREQTK